MKRAVFGGFKVVLLLLLALLSAAPAQARDECPFFRDPAYWARTPVAPAASRELTVGTLNVYRLFDDEQDDTESTRLTTAQLQARIQRIARYLASDLGAPAVIGLQEVEDDTVLQQLVAALQQQTGRSYRFVLGEKAQGTDIRSALLVDSRIRIVRTQSLFAALPFERGPRFDRLPLVVQLDVGALPGGADRKVGKHAGQNPADQVTVVVVHLKSQRGLEQADEAERVLAKRRHQATELAVWTRAQVAAGTRLLVLGDFNAPAPAADPVRAEPVQILLTAGGLVDVAGRFLKPGQRWTYRYRCSLQQLDHLLVSPVLVPAVRGYAIARGDTCLRAREKCRIETSVSDHDGVVLRLGL